jgi:hypothetical protein
VKKANHYHLEMFRAGKWRVVKSQRGRSARLTGLVPGGRYSLRARAVTKKNKAGKASMTVYAWPVL